MSMEKNNFRISYEVTDEAGNGQRVTFEQLGIDYEKLLVLQGEVVQPCILALQKVTGGWYTQATDAIKGKGQG